MSSAVGVDQSGSDDGSHVSEEAGTLAIQAMIESFRQEVAAAWCWSKRYEKRLVGGWSRHYPQPEQKVSPAVESGPPPGEERLVHSLKEGL